MNRTIKEEKILFPLKGYKNNDDYQNAKTPAVRDWPNHPGVSEDEYEQCIDNNQWLGLVIKNTTVIDIDQIVNKETGEIIQDGHKVGKLLLELLKAEEYNFHAIHTPNGYQFMFKHTDDFVNNAKQVTPLGVISDYRVKDKGYIVYPTENTDGRYFAYKTDKELSEVPPFLHAMKKYHDNMKFLPIFPIHDGARNDTFNSWLFEVKNFYKDNTRTQYVTAVGHLLATYMCDVPYTSKDDLKALQATIDSVLSKPNREMNKPKYNIKINEDFDDIPKPYMIYKNELYKETTKKSGDNVEVTPVRVSRDIPRITNILKDIENDYEYYKVQFDNLKRETKSTVIESANVFMDSREIMELSRRGYSINSTNRAEIISYLDIYMSYNVPPIKKAVTRLGHVNGHFIHPEKKNDYEIILNDDGYKKIIEAIRTKGTLEEYRENVFSMLKGNTVALFYFYASLSSILFEKFNAEPIIVDINDKTSTGKTGLLKMASSIYGYHRDLVISWDTTVVNIERRAALLNSFPLFVDDTQKGNTKDLTNFIYNFSNGQSRGRGNITGIDKMLTWRNVLLSTGENSIATFTENKGGAGARAITIEQPPFKKMDFAKMYDQIDKYYGTLSVAFYEQYESNKADYHKLFNQYELEYSKRADGNDVLQRLGRSFSIIQLAGKILSDIEGFETNHLQTCQFIYEDMRKSNKAIDKPKQALESILSTFDTNRSSLITDHREVYRGEVIGAIRTDMIGISPSYLNREYGHEVNSLIKDWKERGFLLHDKDRAQKSVYVRSKKHMMYAIKREAVEELGFDLFTGELEREGQPFTLTN